MKQILSIATIALAAVSFSSCASTDEKAERLSKSESGVSIKYLSPDGRSMTLRHQDGKMPANYPSDVSVYLGARVNGAGESKQGQVISFADIDEPVGETGKFLLLETTDPPEKILDFYSRELERNGWKTQAINVTDARLRELAASKDSRHFKLLVKSSSAKRDIIQVVSP